jgi:hypothetical protein
MGARIFGRCVKRPAALQQSNRRLFHFPSVCIQLEDAKQLQEQIVTDL